MSALNDYVDQANKFRSIFGQTIWDVKNSAHRAEIKERLECDLSPENLTCDGELSGAEVRRRSKLFNKALAEIS